MRGVKKDLEGENINFSKNNGSERKGANKFKSNEWRISKWDKGLVFSFNDSDCSLEGGLDTVMKDFDNQDKIPEGISEATPLNGMSKTSDGKVISNSLQ